MKNQFTAESIKWLIKVHKIEIIWNFLAKSHGKGPADTVGGTVKQKVAAKRMQRLSFC